VNFRNAKVDCLKLLHHQLRTITFCYDLVKYRVNVMAIKLHL